MSHSLDNGSILKLSKPWHQEKGSGDKKRELAKHMGISTTKVKKLLRIHSQSKEKKMSEEKGVRPIDSNTVGNYLRSRGEKVPVLKHKSNLKKIQKAIDQLKKRKKMSEQAEDIVKSIVDGDLIGAKKLIHAELTSNMGTALDARKIELASTIFDSDEGLEDDDEPAESIDPDADEDDEESDEPEAEESADEDLPAEEDEE